MPTTSTLLIVIVTAFVILVIPGPNMLYILTRGIGEGRRTALASSFGIDSGTFLHVIAASVGLSAIVASSELAFTAVKYIGAGYMLVLGIRTLISRGEAGVTAPLVVDGRLKRVYLQGMVISVFNPKVLLFFLSFMPQFVDLSRGNASLQFLIFGLIFFGLGVIVDCVCAISAGSIGNWLRQNPGMVNWQRRCSGVIYLCLGAVTVFSGYTLPSE